MQLPFHTLDVFTDRTFGGNPLGVFPDAAHLPTDLMQRIARGRLGSLGVSGVSRSVPCTRHSPPREVVQVWIDEGAWAPHPWRAGAAPAFAFRVGAPVLGFH